MGIDKNLTDESLVKVNFSLGPAVAQKTGGENGRVGEKLDRVDQVFDELFLIASRSPALQNEATKVLITQMRDTAQNMKVARDLEALEELKLKMVENWNQLREATGGDEQLLTSIQNWGKKFVEEKSIYYDRIGVVKEKMADQSTVVGGVWASMQIELGATIGKISSLHPGISKEIEDLLYKRTMDFDRLEKGNLLGYIKSVSGMEDFITSMTSVNSSFDGQDIDVKGVQDFLGNFIRVIAKLSEKANAEVYVDGGSQSPLGRDPSLSQNLNGLLEKLQQLQVSVAESSKIFMVTKKISDVHFLNMFNEDLAEGEKSEILIQ